jgi:hypothetical protein
VGGDEDMLRDYPFPLSLLSKVLQCMMDLHNPQWGQPLCTLDPVHAGRIGTFGPLLIQRDLYRLARTERWAGSLFSGDRASGMYGPSSRPDLRPRAEILACPQATERCVLLNCRLVHTHRTLIAFVFFR